MAKPFPNTMDFAGWNAPSRIECDIYDLVTEGEVPEEINGNWYRSIPDPQYSPMLGDDTFLSGDGMVSLFRFENGHVDFKMRYVKTERWKAERAARRSLFGLYRNPFTDDPAFAASRATSTTQRRFTTRASCWRSKRTAAQWSSIPIRSKPLANSITTAG